MTSRPLHQPSIVTRPVLPSRAMHLRRVLATLSLLLVTLAPVARARGDGSPAAATQGGYMGAQLEVVSNGLRVVGVAPSGPAASAGLRAGDVIVRARGGPPGATENFTMSVRAAGAGATYPLVVVRGTQQVTINVQLTGVPSRQGMAVGSAPPPLVGLLVMGPGPADLAQLRGRVVVIDFWASWCGPCRQLMPALNSMHQRYAAQGLTVLGITDESAAITRMVGSQMSIGYTMASEPTAASRYGVQNLPTTVVVDRRGTVRRIAAGVDGDELRRLESLVRQLLAEPAP